MDQCLRNLKLKGAADTFLRNKPATFMNIFVPQVLLVDVFTCPRGRVLTSTTTQEAAQVNPFPQA